MLLVLAMFMGLAPGMTAASEDALDPGLESVETVAEPTVLAPVEPTLEPDPTLPPTIEPTAAPTAAVAPPPMPTDVPEANPELDAAPTVTPAPTTVPETEPVPEPTTGPEPTPTPTPTAGSLRAAPMSVTPGEGDISGCTQVQATDGLGPGQVLEVRCSYTAWGSFSPTYIVGAPQSTVPGAATGWAVRLTTGTYTTGWVSSTATLATQSPVPTSLTIELRAPMSGGVQNAVVTSVVSVQTCNSGGQCRSGSTTVGAGLVGANLGRVTMSCAPASPITIVRLQTGVVTCTVSVPSDFPATTSVAIRSVTIPAAPSGWGLTTSPTGVAGANGAVTITPNRSLSPGGSWSFTITLAPACTATSTASGNITSRIAEVRGGTPQPEVAGPGASYLATASQPETSLSTSLTDSATSFAFTASFDSQSQSGRLAYRVNAGGCAGWDVSIDAEPFTYTGTVSGAGLPAASLTLASIGNPVALEGSASGLVTGTSTGPLDTGRVVLTGPATNASGVFQQELGIMVTLPPATAVGEYESTITITAASAP